MAEAHLKPSDDLGRGEILAKPAEELVVDGVVITKQADDVVNDRIEARIGVLQQCAREGGFDTALAPGDIAGDPREPP